MEYVVELLAVLNEFEARQDEALVPYIGSVEVKMEGEVVGYVRDEVGGAYMCESLVQKPTVVTPPRPTW